RFTFTIATRARFRAGRGAVPAGVTQRRHDAAMDEVLALRPVAEEDLPFLERLTQDPAAAGEYAWAGWRNLLRFRQGWAEDRLVGDDGGVLLIARGSERVGFVSWFQVDFPPSYYWSIGIALLPEARGKGHGTQAHRLLTQYLF